MFRALGCCLSQFHKPSIDSAFAGKVLQPVKAMYKNNKFTVILPMVVAAAIVIGILLGGLVFKSASPIPRKGNLAVPGGGKLDMLMSLIANRYVDTVSLDSITEKAIPLILDELDPHSVYVPAKEMAAMNESLDGEFDGIGVMFNMATDTVIVLNVINAGPSAKAGVLGGDRIIKINDTVVAGVKMSQDEVMKRLRGPRGSQVKLGIQRIGVKELVPITVTRGVIPIHCINAAYMITPEIGYVVFAQFSRTAYRELMNAISLLQSQGMKKLILDLRGNPGGFLDQAIAIANEIKRRKSDAEILFVGAENRMEMEKVPAAGYRIVGLNVVGLNRKQWWKNFSLPFKLASSLRLTRRMIFGSFILLSMNLTAHSWSIWLKNPFTSASNIIVRRPLFDHGV